MKIQGMNPYVQLNNKSRQIQQNAKGQKSNSDQLKISDEALLLQKNKTKNVARQEYVSKIKSLVESNEYKVNYEKTAEKMLRFFLD